MIGLISLDRCVAIALLAAGAAGALLFAAREGGLSFTRWRRGVAGLDIHRDDLEYFTDPELRTPEVAEFEVWQLEEEPLEKRLFWGQFVAPSRPMVVRGGLDHWAGDDWSFASILRHGSVAQAQVPLGILPHGQKQLDDGIVRRPAEARLSLGQALQRMVQEPCDGAAGGDSAGDRARWRCAVEGAMLPPPRLLRNRDEPTTTTLAAYLAQLEPPFAALLQRTNVSMWLNTACHRTLLQFNSEESFLVHVAGPKQRVRLYDPLQLPFLYRTARSEVHYRPDSSVTTIRRITLEECPWLDAELPQGTTLFLSPQRCRHRSAAAGAAGAAGATSHGDRTPDCEEDGQEAEREQNQQEDHEQGESEAGMVMVARLPWDWPGQATDGREGDRFAVPADAISQPPADTNGKDAHTPQKRQVSRDDDEGEGVPTGPAPPDGLISGINGINIVENISPIGGNGEVSPGSSAHVYLDNDVLQRVYPVALEAVPIEAELGPGDVLYVPALWWYQRTTLAADHAATAESNCGSDSGASSTGHHCDGGGGGGSSGPGDISSDITNITVTLDYRYSAHSQSMLRVAAALREQMSLE